MKKPLAILVLIVGGAAGITLAALLGYMFFIVAALMLPTGAEWILYTVLVIFIYLIGYPTKHLGTLYKKKYSVGTPAFLVCFCAPSVIASVLVGLTYKPAPDAVLGVDTAEFRVMFWLFAVLAFSLGVILRETITAVSAKRKKR